MAAYVLHGWPSAEREVVAESNRLGADHGWPARRAGSGIV